MAEKGDPYSELSTEQLIEALRVHKKALADRIKSNKRIVAISQKRIVKFEEMIKVLSGSTINQDKEDKLMYEKWIRYHKSITARLEDEIDRCEQELDGKGIKSDAASVHANEPSTEKYRKAFDDIMKSEKQILKLLFAKLIFLGPPERGKTLTRLRLVEEFENMESDPKYKNNPSTPVARGESYLITDMSQTAAVASESGWKSLKEQSEEVKLLYQLFYKLKQDAGTSLSAEPQSDMPDYSLHVVHQIPPKKKLKLSDSGSYMKSFLDMLDKSLASHSWEELSDHLENMCLLYIKDTGGQPELMDMLPALIIGPALYLLFCRLGEDVDTTYKVSLRGISDSCIPDRMSCCTVRENLMSALSSIFSMYSYTARSKSEAENPLFDRIIEGTPEATAYIVGTHKDEVSTEQIIQFDKEMQEVIKDTVFYEEDVVHFVSRDGFESSDPKDIMPEGRERLVYPIDNRFGTKKEIKCFQRFIHKALSNFPRPEIPARWLPFSLFLRFTDRKYVELDICYEHGKELRMSESETDVALWFFHHRTGIIMYFPNVPELKLFVITDTQFVYDSISNLIFENGVSISKSSGEALRRVGQISFDDIKKISGGMFPPKQMEALLKHLNVIAPLNESLTGKLRSRKHHVSQLYFMPCVLKNSSEEELKEFLKCKLSGNVTVYSLKICYECGFVPIGVFPAMIAKVVGQASSTGKYPFQLLDEDNIRKNLIKFNYGSDGDTVVFICTVKCYEVIIIRRENCKTPASQVCTEVRKTTESTLQAISNYCGVLLHTVGSMCGSYQLAFDCPDHPEEDHLCLLEIGDDDPSIMKCETSRKVLDMKAEHRVWFGHDCASDPQINGCTIGNITAMQNMASETLSQPYQDPTLNDAALQEMLERIDSSNLGSTDLPFILQELRNEMTAKWQQFVNRLGLEQNNIDIIQVNYQGNCPLCLQHALHSWLSLNYKYEKHGRPCWRKIAEAVKDLDSKTLFIEIAKKHANIG